MSNISDELDNVIEKLDGMTSETVEKDFDMTIASKIDHISKQLEFVNSSESNLNSTGTLVIHEDQDTGALDKTWKEIYDSFITGQICIILTDDSGSDAQWFVKLIGEDESIAGRFYLSTTATTSFETFDGPNGYPVEAANTI